MKARYVCPQFKRQYFLQTIENSNLLTNFTTDFTCYVLTIEQITKQTPFLVFYVYTACGQKIRKSFNRQLNPGLLRKPTASFPVVLGDFGCDVTSQVCRENSPVLN